jgi:hypothetical protein
VAGAALRESAGQRAADKAANAGDEDAHHRRLCEKPWPAQIYLRPEKEGGAASKKIF